MQYHLENGVNKDALAMNETVETSCVVERLEEGVSLEHLNASRR